jgi:hypothetical protein
MFKKGDRVKLSPDYWEHYKRTADMKDRIGVVVGMARHGKAVRVRWDGNAPGTIEYYANDFIQQAHESVDYAV